MRIHLQYKGMKAVDGIGWEGQSAIKMMMMILLAHFPPSIITQCSRSLHQANCLRMAQCCSFTMLLSCHCWEHQEMPKSTIDSKIAVEVRSTCITFSNAKPDSNFSTNLNLFPSTSLLDHFPIYRKYLTSFTHPLPFQLLIT